jgi:hypothetical protein
LGKLGLKCIIIGAPGKNQVPAQKSPNYKPFNNGNASWMISTQNAPLSRLDNLFW